MENVSNSAGKHRPQMLHTTEAAEYLNVTPHTLEVWRCTGRHKLPFVKVGRLVRYRVADLDAWLASRTVCGEAA